MTDQTPSPASETTPPTPSPAPSSEPAPPIAAGVDPAPAAPAQPAPGSEAAPAAEVPQLGGTIPQDQQPKEGEEPKPEDPPAVPEAYELEPPEGVTIDPELLTEATPVLQELGLSNEQANKLMPVAAKFMERAVGAAQQQALDAAAALKAEWGRESLSDPVLGGSADKLKANIAIADRGLKMFADADTIAFLQESGLSTHPGMIRAWLRVGQSIGEDGAFFRPESGAPQKGDILATMYPDDVPKT